MMAAAVLALMVWAGMLGRPEDFDGGNRVLLKDGNPGVNGSPDPRWTCARRPDVELKNYRTSLNVVNKTGWWCSGCCCLLMSQYLHGFHPSCVCVPDQEKVLSEK